MANNRRARKHQRLMNNVSYNIWFNRLANICQNRFRWELPETCDADMIERAYFRAGRACVFIDDIIGPVSLPFTNASPLNIYGYPAKVQPYSFYCGVNYGLIPLKDCAVSFANTQRISDYSLCDYYAMRLADLSRTIDVNLTLQKAAAGAVVGSEAQKNSVVTAVKRIAENDVFIVVDKDQWQNEAITGKQNALSTFSFNVPFIADKLQIEAAQLFNEFLTAVGIENSNMDKKERVNSSETNGNIGAIEAARNIALAPRRRLCEDAKKKLGIDMSVTWDSDIATLLNAAFSDIARDQLSGSLGLGEAQAFRKVGEAEEEPR